MKAENVIMSSQTVLLWPHWYCLMGMCIITVIFNDSSDNELIHYYYYCVCVIVCGSVYVLWQSMKMSETIIIIVCVCVCGGRVC